MEFETPNVTMPSNMSFSCVQHDVLGRTEKNLYRYLFPLVLLLAVLGNLANVCVYQHPYLRDSSTVRMLLARSVSCLLFVLCMVPNFMYACQTARDQQPQAVHRDDWVANLYWRSLKFVLFGSNSCCMVAVWLTVAVTAEHYILVAFPIWGKKFSSLPKANLIIFAAIPLALLTHIYNLIALLTVPIPQCDLSSDWIAFYFIQRTSIGELYPRIYFWLSSTMMHLLPMVLLIVCSFGIYKKLILDGKFHTNSEQKQCVTRLALATTACHLIFEFPQVLVFACAAIYGGEARGWSLQEPMSAVANFLSLINASIPFLVYVVCSEKFRHLAMLLFCHKSRLHRMPSDQLRKLDPNRRRSLEAGHHPSTMVKYSPVNLRPGDHSCTSSILLSNNAEATSVLVHEKTDV